MLGKQNAACGLWPAKRIEIHFSKIGFLGSIWSNMNDQWSIPIGTFHFWGLLGINSAFEERMKSQTDGRKDAAGGRAEFSPFARTF